MERQESVRLFRRVRLIVLWQARDAILRHIIFQQIAVFIQFLVVFDAVDNGHNHKADCGKNGAHCAQHAGCCTYRGGNTNSECPGHPM